MIRCILACIELANGITECNYDLRAKCANWQVPCFPRSSVRCVPQSVTIIKDFDHTQFQRVIEINRRPWS